MKKIRTTPSLAAMLLVALGAPVQARIGEDEKQLTARYGEPRARGTAEDGTVFLTFVQGDIAIRATLWKAKCHLMEYFPAAAAGGKLAREKVEELLAANAPGEKWLSQEAVRLATQAKLEAVEANGRLSVLTLEYKAREAAEAARVKKAVEAEKEKNKSREMPALDSYIGLSVAEAGKRAEQAGLKWRVIREDGEDFVVTLDYSETRVNFTVVKGKVTAVKNG